MQSGGLEYSQPLLWSLTVTRSICLYQIHVDNLRDQVSRDLRSSARSYYTIGIDVFHESRMRSWIDFQPAIGNLAISVELLLKAVIAKKTIKMLYSNLPDEAQLLLCYPESLSKEHNSTSYLNDLKNFSFKAIEIDKAISLFYHFYPEVKKEYKQFFSSLSAVRNISVHASVPDFQKYELERVAYFSTKLFSTISNLKIFKEFSLQIDRKTENFLKYYEDEKVKKVKVALDRARDVVKRGKVAEPIYYSEDWEMMHHTCPICDNTGVYSGETEDSSDEDGITLTFQCVSFSCEACGLELEDYEELELAGMETAIDRDGDVEQWAHDHGYDDHYELKGDRPLSPLIK